MEFSVGCFQKSWELKGGWKDSVGRWSASPEQPSPVDCAPTSFIQPQGHAGNFGFPSSLVAEEEEWTWTLRICYPLSGFCIRIQQHKKAGAFSDQRRMQLVWGKQCKPPCLSAGGRQDVPGSVWPYGSGIVLITSPILQELLWAPWKPDWCLVCLN